MAFGTREKQEKQSVSGIQRCEEGQFQVEKNRSCMSCLKFLLGKCFGLIQLSYTRNCVFTLAELTETSTSIVKPAHFRLSNVTFSHAL